MTEYTECGEYKKGRSPDDPKHIGDLLSRIDQVREFGFMSITNGEKS